MEEVQKFFDKWNGKGIDFDNAYSFQCMDLYQFFNRDVVGAFHVPNPAAADVWNNYPTNFYTKVSNSPTAVVQKGDVVIWKKTASLPFGHIAIANEGDINRFSSFDQNWPVGSKCHIQEHKYTGVIGWLRPNKFIANVAEPAADLAFMDNTRPSITDQTRIPQIGNKEVQAIRSELQATHDRVQQLDQQKETLGNNLLLAGSKYEDLTKEFTGYKAQNPPLAGLSLLELFKLWLDRNRDNGGKGNS